jgi:hypothetical protein
VGREKESVACGRERREAVCREEGCVIERGSEYDGERR